MPPTNQHRTRCELRHLPEREQRRATMLTRARERATPHGAEAFEVDRAI
jgi:hypothetical protein